MPAPSDELVTAIHRETEGILFVGELVRLLASEGRLEEAVSDAGTLTVPQGVREVIEHRLGRLSDDCKRLLSVASVLGREFQVVTLSWISDRPKGRFSTCSTRPWSLESSATFRWVEAAFASPTR